MCVATVSQYINAFAITQLCGVFCAPWNGLIMDRHRGKPRVVGNANNAKHSDHMLLEFFNITDCIISVI